MTNEEKLEIEKIIRETLPNALDLDRIKRMERSRAEAKPEPEPEKETKLYLISMSGDRMAFPMDNGSAVLHQSFYGRVTREKALKWMPDSFKFADIEVVAFSDARILPTPIKVALFAGVVGMAEVPTTILKEQ